MGDIINAGADLLGFGPASKQADAAKSAADAGLTASREATALQKAMYDQTRQDQSPWRNAGSNALAQLSWGMGLPQQQANGLAQQVQPATGTAGSWQTTPGSPGSWFGGEGGSMQGGTPSQQTWVPGTAGTQVEQALSPTQGQFQGQGQQGSLNRNFGAADFQADPGYAFRLSEGLKGLERSAAARGGLLSGAALKGITRYNQDMGSQEYQNAYNRFNSDQSTQYNRLAAMAGLGQTANGVNAAAGQNYANQAGSNMMGAGNAMAAGQVGSANAINNGISQGLSSYQNNQMMNWLKGTPATANMYGSATDIPMQPGGGY
jgi:hypothetical protein